MAGKGINVYSNEKFFNSPHRGSRPPRTITEMAEEFGVKRQVLVWALNNDVGAPPKLFKTGCTSVNSWYDPLEMRKWWKARGDTNGK